ncbi:ParB family chromosome partitioning protein [Pseudoduganella lurida]|uniref:ParB family chromosome partitioning protein n=1 Tax=Pseudoduganella lurida TaxID=1036180 RepID=A0A562RKY3_9BURK|nr:ParB N-terminal domain-containing protein [Pseudoduganella lurida]TWI69264.1 ParB family chromosome partitioning protein [Pseudoduganella lurida]
MSAVLNTPIHPAASTAQAPHAVALRHATLACVLHAQLVRSAYNVRRKGAPIHELKALIRSQGLLQNLIGYWQVGAGGVTGLIEIVAGERRMLALGELIAEGALPPDYEVPVLIVSRDEAVAISLAENMGREPMHPADLFDAMLALAGAGRDAHELALAFGTDVQAVRRWLRLAKVAPSLLDLYRNGHATHEQMTALAVSDDQEAQRRAWEALPDYGRSPNQLRQLLTSGDINVRTDRVARFVGVAALEQAGAVIRRDLFSEKGDGYLGDTALLADLAVARLERIAQRVRREGHAWVSVVLRVDAAFVSYYARAPLLQLEPDLQQKAQLAAIDNETAALRAQSADGLNETQRAARDRRLQRLYTQRQGIERALVVPEPQIASLSGALVTLDHEGRPTIYRHLIRPEDKSKLPGAEAPKRAPRPLHPEKLIRLLTTHRTLALAAEVVRQPHAALALAVQALWRDVTGGPSHGAGIRLLPFHACPEAADSPAARALADVEERLAALAVPPGVPLAWCMAQTPETLLTLLAFAVARSVDTVLGTEAPHAAFEELALAVKLDMRQWWQPTAAGYFVQLTKPRIVQLVGEVVSARAAVPLESASKEVAAQLAEQVFAGVDWLPAVLRTPIEADAEPAPSPGIGDGVAMA